MCKSMYFEDCRYLDEEFERVKRVVIEALREKELSFDRVEVHESGDLNFRIEVYGLDRISMDCSIEIPEMVNELGIRWIYHLAGKPFPLDFEISGDEEGLRLRI